MTSFVRHSLTMESRTDLERTYSREQHRLGDGFEGVATPVALVRSVTSKSLRSLRSQRSSRSRSTFSFVLVFCVMMMWLIWCSGRKLESGVFEDIG
jgi:hypothetical protein